MNISGRKIITPVDMWKLQIIAIRNLVIKVDLLKIHVSSVLS